MRRGPSSSSSWTMSKMRVGQRASLIPALFKLRRSADSAKQSPFVEATAPRNASLACLSTTTTVETVFDVGRL